MKYSLTVLFLVALFLGCDTKQGSGDSSVLQSKNLIAYIENPSQKGSNGLLWGRIVIMDIDSQQKFYISKKESYVNNPVWITDSRKLVYISEAEVFNDPSYPLKYKSNQDIVAFNLKSRKIKLLLPEFEKNHQKFYMMTRKVIGFTKGNYLKPQLNEVFEITTPEYKISKVVELDSSYFIHDIDLSPDKNILILDVLELNTARSGFIVYSLKDSALKFTTKIVCSGGGWDISGRHYLFCNTSDIREYSCVDDSIKVIQIPVNKPSDVAYTREGNIIGLAKKQGSDSKNNEIFMFYPKEKRLIWLTNDKIFKESLSVLF